MVEKECEKCGEKHEFKNMGKIKGVLMCKSCLIENRKNRRKELLKNDKELKEDLRIIKNKIAKTYKITKKEIKQLLPPEVKGSTHRKAKIVSNSYLTLEEQQLILRKLMSKGHSFEEAKERIKEIKKQLAKTKNSTKQESKTISKEEMLEELFRK